MVIKNANLTFKNSLSKRKSTDKLILHHAAAASCSVQDIHSWHLANGWSGIGYHFFIRKNGEVWQGRQIDTVGAHAAGSNSRSVGICFEGNFENEIMSDFQLSSGIELVSYIKSKYSGLQILKHSDVNATACPGKSFPFKSFTGEEKADYTLENKTAVLKKGSKGESVRLLQEILNKHGANPVLDIDGSFGAKTETAVREFQRKKGLTADASVGPMTWAALHGETDSTAGITEVSRPRDLPACAKCTAAEDKLNKIKTILE